MAGQSGEKSKFVLAMIFLFICLILVLFLAPGSMPRSALEKEKAFTRSLAGEQIALDIERRATRWSNAIIDQEAWVQTARETRLPLTNQVKLSAFLVERVDAASALLESAMYRFASMLAWILPVLPLMLGAVIDGIMERRKRQYQFRYISHTMHFTAAWGLTVIVLGSLAGSLVPFPIPYVAMIFVSPIVAWLLWSWIANLPKRF